MIKSVSSKKVLVSTLKNMSDQELIETYVPNVYQKDIYHIDYQRLKDAGIKVISFDVDDTFGDVAVHNVHQFIPGHKIMTSRERSKAKALVDRLHHMGFIVVLLTNAHKGIARGVYEEICADDYIEDAGKPSDRGFYLIQWRHDYAISQMAHVGDNIQQDVGGANMAGAVSCLIRTNGFSLKLWKALKKPFGILNDQQLIRKELKQRGIWYKYCFKRREDQYYQLGESQNKN